MWTGRLLYIFSGIWNGKKKSDAHFIIKNCETKPSNKVAGNLSHKYENEEALQEPKIHPSRYSHGSDGEFCG